MTAAASSGSIRSRMRRERVRFATGKLTFPGTRQLPQVVMPKKAM